MGVIPFPDRYDIRREAADSADACPRASADASGGQGEATTCRIDMGMELLPDSNAGRMNPPQLPGQQNAGKQKN